MVNHTKSGAIALGSEMSDSRIINEATYALENNINCIFQTKEGLFLVKKFNDKYNLIRNNEFYTEMEQNLFEAFLHGVIAL